MSDPSSDTETDETSNDSGSNDSGSQGTGHNDQEDGQSKDKNWLEWAVTLAGAAIVLFIVGFLAYEWITNPGTSAELRIDLGAPTVEGEVVVIPVTVHNDGAKVAEAAVVEVCAGAESCAQLTFDYVPFKSKVTGAVGLEAPLAVPPSSRMVSYRNP